MSSLHTNLEALRDLAAIPVIIGLGAVAVIAFLTLILLFLLLIATGELLAAMWSLALACIAVRNVAAATRAMTEPGWWAIGGIAGWSGVALVTFYAALKLSPILGYGSN